jgi:hypothetical protein
MVINTIAIIMGITKGTQLLSHQVTIMRVTKTPIMDTIIPVIMVTIMRMMEIFLLHQTVEHLHQRVAVEHLHLPDDCHC